MTKQDHLTVINILHETRAFKFDRIIIEDALFAEPQPDENNYPSIKVFGSSCGEKHDSFYSTEIIGVFLPTGFVTVIEVDEHKRPYLRIFN